MLCAVLFLISITQAALTYKGVDWSSLFIEENSGHKYINPSGATQPLETILKSSGVNTVRQRVWVNPSGGSYNLDYNLNLTKRAQDAGLKVYLDFHFSDTWADPGHQTTPSAWKNYDIDDLSYALYNYTKDTMDSFHRSSLSLSLVSIGNEITNGLLWPLGQQSVNGFSNIARLLHSASAGIKDSSISPKPLIMIHLDNGWNWGTQQWWYDGVLSQGVFSASDYDVQGVSYYPFYGSGALLSSLETSLANMKKRYGKMVMVVETDWPLSCPNPKYPFPADTKAIPFSAVGQSSWMKVVASDVETAGGDGVFYWEPAWLDNANLGSSCSNNLMFDNQGKVLSSLAVFQQI